MTINKEELRRLAEAAIAEADTWYDHESISAFPEYDADELYVIKANPSTILALLDELEAAQKDAGRFQQILNAVVREIPKTAKSGGNAPGHAHEIPGIWNSDNGDLSGTECAWCKAWSLAEEAMQEQKP